MRLEDNLNVVEIGSRRYRYGSIWFNSDSISNHANGPASIHCNGNQFYRINGALHNLKGPAISVTHGDVYYINNIYMEKEEWDAEIKRREGYAPR